MLSHGHVNPYYQISGAWAWPISGKLIQKRAFSRNWYSKNSRLEFPAHAPDHLVNGSLLSFLKNAYHDIIMLYYINSIKYFQLNSIYILFCFYNFISSTDALSANYDVTVFSSGVTSQVTKNVLWILFPR